MSHYTTRWCLVHGDWDDDVDSPGEGCPLCIVEGKFKTRAMLEAEIVALKARQSDVSRDAIIEECAKAVEVGECKPKCDSYAHEDDCPAVYPEAAIRALKSRDNSAR